MLHWNNKKVYGNSFLSDQFPNKLSQQSLTICWYYILLFEILNELNSVQGERQNQCDKFINSVNNFSHPLCQYFGKWYISEDIDLYFVYGKTCLFCTNQGLSLSLSVISGGEAGGTNNNDRIPVLCNHSSSKHIYSQWNKPVLTYLQLIYQSCNKHTCYSTQSTANTVILTKLKAST